MCPAYFFGQEVFAKGGARMKRRHMFLTMMTLLFLLISVSAWAMLPEDGIYEKKDESGNVTARMFIITLNGKASETQEGRTMETSPGAPIIAMQALDGYGRRGGNGPAPAGRNTAERHETVQQIYPGSLQHVLWPAGGFWFC